MIVLGIDQAYKHSGFTIFTDGQYTAHGSYVVPRDKAANTKDEEVKFDLFHLAVNQMIDQYKPQFVVCEKGFLGLNARVFSLISELTGMLRSICYYKNIVFETVPIAKYRSFFGLPNKKDAVTAFVKSSNPHLQFANDDETDSFLLAKYASYMWEQRLDKAEIEA